MPTLACITSSSAKTGTSSSATSPAPVSTWGRCYVSHATRYANPLSFNSYPDKQDDVFALGTVLYELEHGSLLYAGMTDGEIASRLRDGRFPDLSGLEVRLRAVIEKCWTVQTSAAEAARELGRFACGGALAWIYPIGLTRMYSLILVVFFFNSP